MHNILIYLFITLLLIMPGMVQADRAIPENNLEYPVLIVLNNESTGSGFYINNGTDRFFVTAKHVLFDMNSGELNGLNATILSYSSDPNERNRNVVQLDLPMLLASNKVRKHASEDTAVVCIAKKIGVNADGGDSLKVFAGASVLEKTKAGIMSVQPEAVKRFKDILIANTVYMFGYPTSIGIKEIPQIDPVRPLLRSGIIAGTNPTRRTIILDLPSYPGNSGGPVLEVEHVPTGTYFKLIGVISQFVPFSETWVNRTQKYQYSTISNSGYTVAVSMDSVYELMSSPCEK